MNSGQQGRRRRRRSSLTETEAGGVSSRIPVQKEYGSQRETTKRKREVFVHANGSRAGRRNIIVTDEPANQLLISKRGNRT
jgi:hypothetical protein